MAQLPPRVPNMTPHWPNFHHQRLPSLHNLEPNTTHTQTPSWIDEFLDFSSSKRGSHRRSASDSIAFLELPTMMAVEEERHKAPPPPPGAERTEFERFDDEQFMSMFTDEMPPAAVGPTLSSSGPSTPTSDHNSFNEDEKQITQLDQHLVMRRKNETEEVQSSCKSDGGDAPHAINNDSNDKIIIDPKRVKRILANRQSAQRSRVRKLQYISELERSVTSLQAEVSVLSPRVAFLDHQRLVLNVDNNVIKQRIAALAQDKVFKDAHQEALRREIERLRQVYYNQSIKKMENDAPPSSDATTVDVSEEKE